MITGNINLLASNQEGYIGLCESCGKVQVCLGNFLSEVDHKTFRKLWSTFVNSHTRYFTRKRHFSALKQQLIYRIGGENNVYLRLDYDQLDGVISLFEDASIGLLLQSDKKFLAN